MLTLAILSQNFCGQAEMFLVFYGSLQKLDVGRLDGIFKNMDRHVKYGRP